MWIVGWLTLGALLIMFDCCLVLVVLELLLVLAVYGAVGVQSVSLTSTRSL